MPNLSYLFAFLLPISSFLGMYYGGPMAPGGMYLAFVIIPILELLHKPHPVTINQKIDHKYSGFYNFLLYLNLPILYSLYFYFIYRVYYSDLSTLELIAYVFNLGLTVGVLGINVAHELGHRKSKFDKIIAKLLLLPALYVHFTIEHNHWHHKYVSTPLDPSSAKKGENIYSFWVQSIVGVFIHAFKIQYKELQRRNTTFWGFHNTLLLELIVEAFCILVVFIFLGVKVGIALIVVALIAILLLESINYIEHYGLIRNKLASQFYEPVQSHHSWNSDHRLGRIFLYELTLHSDHHFKASTPYYKLQSLPNAPQLCTGYPGSILLAMIPMLWFWVMDPKIPRDCQRLKN